MTEVADNYLNEMVSEWVLFNSKISILLLSCQPYHDENKLHFHIDDACFVLEQNTLLDSWSGSIIYNNSTHVDMSHHSDTVFRFSYNKHLPLLLIYECLMKKQQGPR